MAQKYDETFFLENVVIYDKELYFFLLGFTSNPEDANDIKQETFLKAWLKLDQLKDPKHVKAWIFSIAYNEFRMIWRKNKKDRDHILDLECFEDIIDNLECMEDCPEERVIIDFDTQLALQALEQMKPEARKWVQMQYIDGLEPYEISEILKINRSTVRSSLTRSTAKFRKIYHKLEKGEGNG